MMSASSIGMVDLMPGRIITSRHHYHQSSVDFMLTVRRARKLLIALWRLARDGVVPDGVRVRPTA
jgi:hypothetical protein